jgi:hypothetical protein
MQLMSPSISSGLTLATSPAARAEAPPVSRPFCIFYGWLIADVEGTPAPAAQRIAAEAPDLLIAAPFTMEPRLANLSASVLSLLRAAGVRTLAYVATEYGRRPEAAIQSEAEAALALGATGVIFDQVDPAWGEQPTSYCAAAALVHAASGIVAINTGVANADERHLEHADLLLVEHQWHQFQYACPALVRYGPARFMGVSSNEPGAYAALGYSVDAAVAARDGAVAAARGVGWHCATDRYVELPPWPLASPRATP